MKIRNILFLTMLSTLVISCTLTRRMERKGERAVLSLFQKTEQQDSISTQKKSLSEGWVKRPNGDSLFWSEALTDEDGERRMLIHLEEVRVVGRSKVVVERLGQVTLDFQITVPEQLQGNCLGIVITPQLHDGDSTTKLEQLVVRGGLYGRLQERDSWQFDRYRERMNSLMRNAVDSVRESVLDKAYHRIVRFPYAEGARLDSVVQNRECFDYFYTQQVKPRNDSKQLFVTLEGEVQGLDGSRYKLPHSDTLCFTVSSMLSLIDTLPRFCVRVIDKYAVVQDRNYIAFRVNETELCDTLGDNRRQLERIVTLMDSIVDLEEYYLDSLVMTASSSPEGSFSRNNSLAKERGYALRDYLRGYFGEGIDTTVTVRWVAEDWKTLEKMILEDDSITDKEQIRELITEEKDPDMREKKIKDLFPKHYSYIRHKYYPQLRCVDFRYNLRRRNMIKDTIHTTEPDTLYARGVQLLRERRYADAVNLLYAYKDRNSLIALLSLGYDRSAYEIAQGLPQGAENDYLHAIAAMRVGLRDEAEKYYNRAAKKEPRLKFRAKLDPELTELVNNP